MPIADPATALPLALPLHQVDAMLGLPELSKHIRCRLIRRGEYPGPIFAIAGRQVVLTSDVRAFLEEKRQRAPEEAARNAERAAKMVAGRQAKRAERRAAGLSDPGIVAARAASRAEEAA